MNIHLVLHGLKVSKVMLSIVFMHFVLSGYVLAYFTEHLVVQVPLISRTVMMLLVLAASEQALLSSIIDAGQSSKGPGVLVGHSPHLFK